MPTWRRGGGKSTFRKAAEINKVGPSSGSARNSSLQSSACPSLSSGVSAEDGRENVRESPADMVSRLRVEEEILWCICDILEKLKVGNVDPKTEAKFLLAVKTLRNKSAPLVKKRQAMHAACGDYKSRMKLQEAKTQPGKEILPMKSNGGVFLAHSTSKSFFDSDCTEQFRFNFAEIK